MVLLGLGGSHLLVVVDEYGVGGGGPGQGTIGRDKFHGAWNLVEALAHMSHQVGVYDDPTDPVGKGTVVLVGNDAAGKVVVVDRLAVCDELRGTFDGEGFSPLVGAVAASGVGAGAEESGANHGEDSVMRVVWFMRLWLG